MNNIPTIRSYDKINIMAGMELTEIQIDVQPASIIKCRSRDKINQLDKSIEPLEKQKDILEGIEEKELNPEQQYILSIQLYFLYLIYGFLGGVIFNSFSSPRKIVRFDMIFNCIISPIIYYHSPKHILMKIDKFVLLCYYTPFFILGLCFRFLDIVPQINEFTLNLITIDTTIKIVLSTLVLIGVFVICSYYIYKSRFPKINTLLFILYLTATILSFYFFYNNGGTIYFHHYFIGLLVMIISRNYHSNIVVIIHAIAYGVYIDGISRWGFASIYQ